MPSCTANKILKSYSSTAQELLILKNNTDQYGLLLGLGSPAVKNQLGKVGKEINNLIHKTRKSLGSEKCNSGKRFESNIWEDKSIFKNKKFVSKSRQLSEKSVKNKLKCNLQIN